MMKFRILFLLLLTTILFVAGCNQVIPVVEGTEEIIWIVPEPGATTGVVIGVLIGGDGNVEIGGTPFLSKNITANQADLPPTISFSLQYDPRAIVNEATGEFYFTDVEPAENYVITILYGPGNSYIVREQDSEYPLSIKIEAGQLVDLGKILVEEP
ncbi:MAG: hypothetical protein ABIG43_05905 [Chloroflexota bacterium]